MAVLERRLPKPSSFFLGFAKDYTSQGGEDGILEEIYRLLDESITNGQSEPFPKYCIDIGAWDGKHLSNTYNLLNNYAWSGLLVEAESSRYEQLTELYSHCQDRVTCISQLVGFEGESSLSSLLTKHHAPKNPGFLCIDIDGADYHLWKSIATTCQAIVVCIEFNPTIPNDVYFIQPAQIDIQQGSSLSAIQELGQSLGYTLIVTTTFNAIFLRNDYVKALPTNPEIVLNFNQIDRLHCPSMTTAMFQTYDGELKYAGTKKLLWHKVALNPQKLQMLSKRDRKYPFAPSSESNHLFVKVEEIQGDCQGAIDRLGDNDDADNSQIEEVVKGIQSLIDLSHLPVIEETSTEILNKLLFSFAQKMSNVITNTNIASSHSLCTMQWLVDVMDVVINQGLKVLESDSQSALKFFEMAESVLSCIQMDSLISEGSSAAIIFNNLVLRVRVNMVRCHRLHGSLLAAWKLIRSIEHDRLLVSNLEQADSSTTTNGSSSESEDEWHSLFFKEKKKLQFLLNVKK